MKRLDPWYGVVWLFITLLLILGVSFQPAAAQSAGDGDVARGAALYDHWAAELDVQPPAGSMPLWDSQSTNTRSGADTWRCSTCHGWDYQGKDGAYRAGSNYTGFPGVLTAAQKMDTAQIVAALQGKTNPQHDFSPYLDDASLNDLAAFLKEGAVDDSQFIDPTSLKVLDGDSAQGKTLYDQRCASCHGSDGAKIAFRFEGTDATLGTLAAVDPWRFLHKTRFGTPGTHMPIGYEQNWTAQEGRDVLLYAQSLPGALPETTQNPSLEGRPDLPDPSTGGPAQNFFTAILTALGAMAASLGFAVLLGGALIGILLLIVWLIRGRK